MRDIERVEFRESQTQTQGYVSRFKHQALRPRLYRMKDFHYLHLGLHKGYKPNPLHMRRHKDKAQSLCTKQVTSTQGGRHKPKHKAKDWLQHFVITKITDNTPSQ